MIKEIKKYVYLQDHFDDLSLLSLNERIDEDYINKFHFYENSYFWLSVNTKIHEIILKISAAEERHVI